MSAPVLPTRPKIDDTYGAAFIGMLFATMLYGLTTLQTYFYFVYYPQDGMENKFLVSLVWFLDTIQTVLVSESMYHYLVTNYANPPALAIGHWSLFVSIAVNVTVSFCVQCFFTVRIFRLSPHKVRWWLSSFIALIVLSHFCIGIRTVIFLLIEKEMKRLPEIKLTSATPFATLSVLADTLIALALCILLHGSRTGFRHTNKLVTMLMIYAINRCLLTSFVELAAVIVFVISPGTLWFLGIEFVIGKLYANSLLATLNSRNALGASSGTMQSVPLSGIEFQQGTGGDISQRSIVLNISNSDSQKAGAIDGTDILTSKNETGNFLVEQAQTSIIIFHPLHPPDLVEVPLVVP
ncbi:hypothetical protein BDZ94DRAFT_1263764 [Collybia nuda]|uniref:DUF6534 domain-containing protein n=1 Tax=Collybia nuda TaxID=64659 RepID=A0A9P5Y4I8_9AGAR|nr:hypothetical protein BDZ94DRAFT_1263764 [Collybia nuda]